MCNNLSFVRLAFESHLAANPHEYWIFACLLSLSPITCVQEEGTEESDEYYMLEISDSVPMYVLTNKQKVNGASCMLYPDLICQFSDRIGKNLFIIPSSVHELLLLPADHKDEASEIRCMIREINDTQVRVEEILSY